MQTAASERIASAESLIQRACDLASDGKFKDALALLKVHLTPPDFRFESVAQQVKRLTKQFTIERDQWNEELRSLADEIAGFKSRFQYQEIVNRLSDIPSGLLDASMAQVLAESTENIRRASDSQKALKSALASKDWATAAQELMHLNALYPENVKYQELIEKVASKILSSAVKLKLEGNHAEALKLMESLAPEYHTEDHQALTAELEELIFTRKLVARSRLAWPLLGNALHRLQRLTPTDTRLTKLIEKFSTASRVRSSSLAILPPWMKNDSGLIQQGITPTKLPTPLRRVRGLCSDTTEVTELDAAKLDAKFWVAYGLALQAVGYGTATGNLMRDQKKGVLSLLTRKKKADETSAWGLDIGDSHIKAVKISRDGDLVHVEDAIIVELKTNITTRRDLRRAEASAVFKALSALAKRGIFGELPVATGAANVDLLTRNISLPTSSPKQHETFIFQEAQANIPIPVELLATAYHKFAPEGPSAVSQNAMLVAVKRTEVDSRRSQLEQLGVRIAEIVPEPFALLNVLNHHDYLGQVAANSMRGAVLVVDVGCCRTSLNVFSRSAGWFRALDWGLDALTTAVARQFKIAHNNAEHLRREPSKAVSLRKLVAVLETECNIPRRELLRSLTAAKEQLGEFQLNAAILVGGGAYQPFLANWINGEDL